MDKKVFDTRNTMSEECRPDTFLERLDLPILSISIIEHGPSYGGNAPEDLW